MKLVLNCAFLMLLSLEVFAGTEIYFIHNDHLGTPRVVTDESQNVVWKGEYGPFGELLSETGSLEQPIRLPGQYADPETGYYYNYYRDYDPTLGQYIQSDPMGLYDGPNTYAYVHNNPINYIDPKGLFALPLAYPLIPPAAAAVGEACAVVGAAAWAGYQGIKALGGWGAYAKPPADAKDPDGAKAPGKPGPDEGFKDPKKGEDWVKNPNGRGNGWADADGNVWVPTGKGGDAHGGSHWDVQKPGGGHVNVYPGGRRR